MGERKRGQVLVLFALLVPVLVLLFFFALSLAALQDVCAHAGYALAVATRAGARQVEYADYGQVQVRFSPHMSQEVKDVFARGLALRTAGLDDTPENIAATVDVVAGYGTADEPWSSPFIPGRVHRCPTVAARVWLPVRVWMFSVRMPIVSETEVR